MLTWMLAGMPANSSQYPGSRPDSSLFARDCAPVKRTIPHTPITSTAIFRDGHAPAVWTILPPIQPKIMPPGEKQGHDLLIMPPSLFPARQIWSRHSRAQVPLSVCPCARATGRATSASFFVPDFLWAGAANRFRAAARRCATTMIGTRSALSGWDAVQRSEDAKT